MTAVETRGDPSRGSARPLWAGVLGVPAIWSLQFILLYMLVPWVCHTNHPITFHIISAVAVALGIAGLVLCYTTWREVGGGGAEDRFGDVTERNRFLAVLGAMVSTLFTIAMIAQAIATFMISPCFA